MLSWLRRQQEHMAEESLEREETPVVVVPSRDLVEVTAVPKRHVPKLWGLVEIDVPLTYLDEREIRWMQWKVSIIARSGMLVEPEVWHPEIVRAIDHVVWQGIDVENAELWGYARLKRAYHALERKLQVGIR